MRIWNATRYSTQGLLHALKYESAFRQELVLAAIALVLLWVLPLSTIEKSLLFFSVVLVLVVELLNSAIEAAVDRVSLDRHPLAGRAKDLGSAAVFLTVTQMIVLWGVIAGPTLWRWLGSR